MPDRTPDDGYIDLHVITRDGSDAVLNERVVFDVASPSADNSPATESVTLTVDD